ncbi:MAG: 50S ribosomal protein L44e [Promethearchaeota archaeon]
MRVPKEQTTYCKKCRQHTKHSVSLYKKGKDRKKMGEGWRRYNRKKKGYGSQPKEVFRKNAKVNKKSLPLLKCNVCGTVHHGKALRLKKFEIV